MKKALLLLLAGIGYISASAQNPAEYKPLEQFNGDIEKYTKYNYVNNYFKPINRKLGDFLEECELNFEIYDYVDSFLRLFAKYGSGEDQVLISFDIKLGDYTEPKWYSDKEKDFFDRSSFKKFDIEEIKDLLDMNVAYYNVILEFVAILD